MCRNERDRRVSIIRPWPTSRCSAFIIVYCHVHDSPPLVLLRSHIKSNYTLIPTPLRRILILFASHLCLEFSKLCLPCTFLTNVVYTLSVCPARVTHATYASLLHTSIIFGNQYLHIMKIITMQFHPAFY